ncbi:hypothetical protein F5Y04DRAFT_279858 [Hypomontagnella monticulosa]|nr:hypothetical protein F5Y04DRAFT_279858 [Hypomontagnella monticulosa]
MGTVSGFFARVMFISLLIICFVMLTRAHPTNMTNLNQTHAFDCSVYQGCNCTIEPHNITNGAGSMGLVGQEQGSTFPFAPPMISQGAESDATHVMLNTAASLATATASMGASETTGTFPSGTATSNVARLPNFVTTDPDATASNNCGTIASGPAAPGTESGAEPKQSVASKIFYATWIALAIVIVLRM